MTAKILNTFKYSHNEACEACSEETIMFKTIFLNFFFFKKKSLKRLRTTVLEQSFGNEISNYSNCK